MDFPDIRGKKKDKEEKGNHMKVKGLVATIAWMAVSTLLFADGFSIPDYLSADGVCLVDSDIVGPVKLFWIEDTTLVSIWIGDFFRVQTFDAGTMIERKDIKTKLSGVPDWAIPIPDENRVILGENKSWSLLCDWYILDISTGKEIDRWQGKGFEETPIENGLWLEKSRQFVWFDGDGKVWAKEAGKEPKSVSLQLPKNFFPYFLVSRENQEGSGIFSAVNGYRHWTINAVNGSSTELPGYPYQVMAMAPLGLTDKVIALHTPVDMIKHDDRPLSLDIINPSTGEIIQTLSTGQPYSWRYAYTDAPSEPINEHYEIRTDANGRSIAVVSLAMKGFFTLYRAPKFKPVELKIAVESYAGDIAINQNGSIIACKSIGTDALIVMDMEGHTLSSIDIKTEEIDSITLFTTILFWATIAVILIELLIAQFLSAKVRLQDNGLTLGNYAVLLALVCVELIAFTYVYVGYQVPSLERGILAYAAPILIIPLVLVFGEKLSITSIKKLIVVTLIAFAVAYAINRLYAIPLKEEDLKGTTSYAFVSSTDTTETYSVTSYGAVGAIRYLLQALRMALITLALDGVLTSIRRALMMKKN